MAENQEIIGNFAVDGAKRQKKAEIKANKQKMALIAQLCEETGRKICYRYVSARSGSTHTISFLARELL